MKLVSSIAFLIILGCFFFSCSRSEPSGQSQVREEAPAASKTPTYGNPPFMNDWKQRGASGLPTKPVEKDNTDGTPSPKHP